MQPLPSWLPTTQRHLGALTAELMQGDGGPVCFGNTVTLRGRGGRYVDFDFLALALTLTLTPPRYAHLTNTSINKNSGASGVVSSK